MKVNPYLAAADPNDKVAVQAAEQRWINEQEPYSFANLAVFVLAALFVLACMYLGMFGFAR